MKKREYTGAYDPPAVVEKLHKKMTCDACRAPIAKGAEARIVKSARWKVTCVKCKPVQLGLTGTKS